MIRVRLVYVTGIKREIFRNVKLIGSWDNYGRFSSEWSAPPLAMERTTLEDGCPSYAATIQLDESEIGRTFYWGVRLDSQFGRDIWGIPTEVHDRFSSARHRSFVLIRDVPEQRYYLTHCHRLGAQKYFLDRRSDPAIRFAVWAPNATKVETVIGKYQRGIAETGYIADDHSGIDTSVGDHGAFSMKRDDEGIWYTDIKDLRLSSFKAFDHKAYMFRVTKDDGRVAYRTDLYSRCQIGKGSIDPKGQPYTGNYKDLDGTVSCSVVIDPEMVARDFEEKVWPEINFVPQADFWVDEFHESHPVPYRIEELIIYELHVGSLGHMYGPPGDFGDAEAFLDYLVDLGVNAVELLPVLQYEGLHEWGYGTSHYFALEFSAGGRDQLKHLIRECHRRGLAVILDVVYNHYHVDAERAEWGYDSDAPERNIYYWYEGHPRDYLDYERAAAKDPSKTPSGHGGYLDNYSTGYAPRFYDETVRKMFISSAIALVEEFHVDGFRVDLTQAMYQFNVRHADGVPVPSANDFGAKFLRELTRTVKMVNPNCMLIAEDHSNLAFVTDSTDQGGLGFDATWYSDFYHHLIGDGDYGSNFARLLYVAGLGDDRALAMDYFAGAIRWSGHRKVVYHEDHDDAGNAKNTARTMVTAVNAAPLVGETRGYAEARCRCVAGLSMLSAGTPMFLMAEEIASSKPFLFEGFIDHRNDFRTFRRVLDAHTLPSDPFAARRVVAERCAQRRMFKFYQDLIRLRRNHEEFCSHGIDVIHTNNVNRVIAFLRTDGVEWFLVVANLNNRPFASGYWFENGNFGGGSWREVFNSDSYLYGGSNVGNSGQVLEPQNGRINIVIPANGFVVFQRVT